MEYLAALALLVLSLFVWYLVVKLGTYARLKTQHDFEQRYPKQERKDSNGSEST